MLVHAINISTAIHASWARLMLGSRAEPIVLGPAEVPPPPVAPRDPTPGSDAESPEGGTVTEGDPVAPALVEPDLTKALPVVTDEPPPVLEPTPVLEPAPVLEPTEAPAEPVEPAVEPATPEPEEKPPAVLEPAAIGEERARSPLVEQAEPISMTPTALEPLANQLVPELDAPLLVTTGEPLESLTPREREVLTLIARGYSNAAIAETFVISEGTVKTHVKRVLAKLDLRDRTQAAIYAYETNFVVARFSEATVAPEPIVLSRTRAR